MAGWHARWLVLSVFDLDAGEEIFQLCDLPFGCSVVMPAGCQLHGAADLTDPIETVPPSVTTHSMSQHPDSRIVLVGQRLTKCVDVFSPVSQKDGDDVLKVAVDMYSHSLS